MKTLNLTNQIYSLINMGKVALKSDSNSFRSLNEFIIMKTEPGSEEL